MLALALAGCTGSGEPGDTDSGTVIDTRPTPPDIALLPLQPTTTDDLEVTLTSQGADHGDDELSTIYRWSRDGAEVPGQDGATVSATGTSRGETWTVAVTSFDGAQESVPQLASVTINNTPPEIEVSIGPTSPTTGDDLAAVVTASDIDGDAVALSFAWTREGTDAGVDGDTLPASATEPCETWTVTVTPSDQDDEGEAASADVGVTSGDPPEVTSLALSPSQATTDDVLEVELETSDPDGDVVTASYAWFVNGTDTGRTGDSLDGADWFERGQEVTVVVTPSDGCAEGEPWTASVVIDNSPPSTPEVSIDPEDPEEPGDDDLVCVIDVESTDADGDAVEYVITWTVDEQAYPEDFFDTADTADTGYLTTGPETTTWPDDTVPAPDTLLGEDWTCTVTASDGVDETSAEAEISFADPYNIGNDSEFSRYSSHTANYLLGSPLAVDEDCTMLSFGIITKASGPNIKMALYTDSGGAPDELVAEVGSTALGLGDQQISVSETDLDAGDYWIMAVYDSTAFIGYSTATTETVQYRGHSFSASLPDPFGSTITYTGQEFNYYIVVK